MVNLQGFDKTTAAAQPASVTQAERITPWHPALASPWQTNTACRVHRCVQPAWNPARPASESLTYGFSNTWRYSKGLGMVLLCASVCEHLTFSRKKNDSRKKKKKRGWDIIKLSGLYQEQSDKTKRRREKMWKMGYIVMALHCLVISKLNAFYTLNAIISLIWAS